MKLPVKTLGAGAVAALAISLSFQPAARADIGDFFKGVANVLTGGLVGLVESGVKVAQGKAKPGDIVNIATGGISGAVQNAHQTVHAAAQGVGNLVQGVFQSIGSALPRLPGVGSLPNPGTIMQHFAQTFQGFLPQAFQSVRRPGLLPGQGLFAAAQRAINNALAHARARALAHATSLRITLPNLAGITQMLQAQVQRGIDLARRVATGAVARVAGQFRALAPATIVGPAVSAFVRIFPSVRR